MRSRLGSSTTRQARPAAAEPHSARITQILDGAHFALLDQGVSTDVAAQRIVDGALAGRPYIFTDDTGGPFIQARTDQILASLSECFPDSRAPMSQRAAS